MDNAEYLEMLEVPVNTVNVTYKPIKKTRKKKQRLEEVKEQLIEKVNATEEVEEPAPENKVEEYAVTIKPKKEKRKVNVIAVQFAVIIALVGVILVSGLLFENTAVNAFFRSVFSTESASTIDNRVYTNFEANIPISSDFTEEDGVMTFSGVTGSVYSPCDGVVTKITEDAGKFIVEIAHSKNFSSKISGISYAYFREGDKVYGNIPIGYTVSEDVSVCFFNKDSMITDYNVTNNSVVWLV